MSEQQEGASGERFQGIPVIIARKETVESIHKLRADALAEQVEKLRVRRDRWRERYEQARADLEEHKQGREVLAELLARNPVALLLERERDEARAEVATEQTRKWRYAAVATASTGAWIAYAIARAVLA